MAGSNAEGDGLHHESTGAMGGLRDGLRSMKPLPPGWTKKVFAWGAGEDGQLGLGNTDDQHLPKEVQTLTGLDICQLVSGSRNSLAVCGDGSVLTWGWNQRGTLGHSPSVKSESTPCKVKDLSGIVQAAIGGWHCLAVNAEGQAYAWGGNEYGQCAAKLDRYGVADQQQSRFDVVRPMRCASNLCVRQVAAGGMHSLVLTNNGQVWTWGQPLVATDIRTERSKPVQVPGLEDVVMIASGAFHCLALLKSQKVMAWGNCEYGQLGLGDTQPRAYPQEVKELTGKNIVDIEAGGWHSMAVSGEGELYAWGRGEHGRLGFGEDKASKVLPQKVTLLEGERIVQVSCGGTHSVALTDDGRSFTFGRGDNGRLGYGTMQTTGHPHELAMGVGNGQKLRGSKNYENGISVIGTNLLSSSGWKVTQIAAGGRHSLVLAVHHTPRSDSDAMDQLCTSPKCDSWHSKGSDESEQGMNDYHSSWDGHEVGQGREERREFAQDSVKGCNGCTRNSTERNRGHGDEVEMRPSFGEWVLRMGSGVGCDDTCTREVDQRLSRECMNGLEQLGLNGQLTEVVDDKVSKENIRR